MKKLKRDANKTVKTRNAENNKTIKFPTNPEAVTAYVNAAPKEAQARLRQVRAALKKAAPGAGEDIKWQLPTISYKRILVSYGAFKKHVGLYPTPSALTHFAKEISKYAHAKGSVQFPHDKPLPLSLITKIAKFRVKESLEKDRKWMEK